MRTFATAALAAVLILIPDSVYADGPRVKKEESPRETVVLLHGIARTGRSMNTTAQALETAGYNAIALTYPSRTQDLDQIAAGLRESRLNDDFWKNSRRVHFVTHSMGGLVVQRYLELYHDDIPADRLGRVVMLAPPNGGSEVADLLHGMWPYQWYYGPAGQELTTAARTEREEPYYEVGIIAGTKEWPYTVAAFVIPGPGDGRVSVENTKIPGMKGHMTVNGTHSFIMNRRNVHDQIIHFLKTGEFDDKPQ